MDKKLSYDESAHRFGRISLILGALATLIYPAILIFYFKIPVNMSYVLQASGSILLLMIPVSLSEFLSVAPMIGTSAEYLMVLTGNYTNLKIPASIAAMEAVGLDPSEYTEESDVISTIAMGVSAIVSELIIIIGVILMVPLSGPLSNPVLAPAFQNIVPALFGAIGVGIISKHFKLAIVPMILSMVLLGTKIINGALVMPIVILVGILSARIMYNKKFVK